VPGSDLHVPQVHARVEHRVTKVCQWSRSQALATIASRHLGIAGMPSELNDRAVGGIVIRFACRSGL
jgi:hypothetical protein